VDSATTQQGFESKGDATGLEDAPCTSTYTREVRDDLNEVDESTRMRLTKSSRRPGEGTQPRSEFERSTRQEDLDANDIFGSDKNG